MTDVLRQQWRDQNAGTNYPFSDFASLVNQDNDQIPPSALIDAVLHPAGHEGYVFLSTVTVSPSEVVLQFAGPSGPVCKGSYKTSNIPTQIELTDDEDRPAGRLVCDSIALRVIAAWPQGEHAFTRKQTQLAGTTVIPTPERGLRGIRTQDGSLFTGRVKLVAEDGVYFRHDHNGVLHVDALGDPLFLRKDCDVDKSSDNFDPGPFLRTINQIPPDAQGRFLISIGTELVDDTVLRIVPQQGGIKFKLVATRSG
jgi:hypothetical protein